MQAHQGCIFKNVIAIPHHYATVLKSSRTGEHFWRRVVIVQTAYFDIMMKKRIFRFLIVWIFNISIWDDIGRLSSNPKHYEPNCSSYMICMFCGVKMDLYVFKKNTFSAKDWHLAISTASADQAGKVHWLPNWEIGPEKKKSLQKSKLKKILLLISPKF